MPVTFKDWKDLPDRTTPITAAALEDMEQRLGAVEGWRTVGSAGQPAFTNAWQNQGGSAQVAQFRKDARTDLVYLRGQIKSGALNNAAFVLPAGYRPPLDANFPVEANGAIGFVFIGGAAGGAPGWVIPFVGATTFFSLNIPGFCTI